MSFFVISTFYRLQAEILASLWQKIELGTVLGEPARTYLFPLLLNHDTKLSLLPLRLPLVAFESSSMFFKDNPILGKLEMPLKSFRLVSSMLLKDNPILDKLEKPLKSFFVYKHFFIDDTIKVFFLSIHWYADMIVFITFIL